MKLTLIILWSVILMAGAMECEAAKRNYKFDGSISEEVLRNYLSRAITMASISDSPHRADDVRMLKSIGAKFVGRAACLWGNPGDDDAGFRAAKEAADLVHKADPEIIMQAAIFEAIYDQTGVVPIPAWVFEEFGLKPEKRNFSYKAMLFDGGKFVDMWGPGGSVPDMSKIETRMWFFYRAKRYIDAGYEAIHFGQVMLMNQADPGEKNWLDMLSRVRRYASKHACRHMILCDAHTHGIAHDGKLMFDFHSFPLRVKDVEGEPEKGILEVGYIDSIFKDSLGGITPSGWKCASLPYIAEVDNWGSSGKGGQYRIGGCWVWGWDEIVWFARQTPEYRNEWLRYAWDWIRKNDPNGYLQMPGYRCLADQVNGHTYYSANTPSPSCPDGFGQEVTIREIWRNAK